MLEGDALGLLRATERILPDPDAELLIVLDQLEEVFTLVEDEDERLHVLESLRAAATARRAGSGSSRRSEPTSSTSRCRSAGSATCSRNAPRRSRRCRPRSSSARSSHPLTGPGSRVEPRLLAAMIADVVDRPGALPLLQYTLTELAERRDDGMLTLAGYRRIGGVSGALARRAEQIFGAMNEDAQDACRQLFLRLVTLGEGSEDTRRRVRRSELVAARRRAG